MNAQPSRYKDFVGSHQVSYYLVTNSHIGITRFQIRVPLARVGFPTGLIHPRDQDALF